MWVSSRRWCRTPTTPALPGCTSSGTRGSWAPRACCRRRWPGGRAVASGHTTTRSSRSRTSRPSVDLASAASARSLGSKGSPEPLARTVERHLYHRGPLRVTSAPRFPSPGVCFNSDIGRVIVGAAKVITTSHKCGARVIHS